MHESIFSVDVEDWFNISATGHEPPVAEWDNLESRVERNFLALLDLFARHGATVTCFFVGYFARRFPHLVRAAVDGGHEVASHSYYHRLVFETSPEEFEEDARRTRLELEDISGTAVGGFRAPAFSVTEKTPWFFDRLAAAGYRYDSSVFPAPHQTGGLKTTTLGPYRIERPAGALIELPITAVRVLGKPMCFFGGGYLRLFPYRVIRRMGQRALDDARPVIFYVHPREIDLDQPRLPMSAKRRFTSYVNLRSTRGKIERILEDFRPTSFAHYLAVHQEQIGAAA